MLNWLLRLWRRFDVWIMQRPVSTLRHPVSEPYQPSNLHTREVIAGGVVAQVVLPMGRTPGWQAPVDPIRAGYGCYVC